MSDIHSTLTCPTVIESAIVDISSLIAPLHERDNMNKYVLIIRHSDMYIKIATCSVLSSPPILKISDLCHLIHSYIHNPD